MKSLIQEVVPWGRNFDEYSHMFALSAEDLEGQILGCADGPASFHVEARQRGISVTSCDPLYQFSAEQIHARIDETYQLVVDEMHYNRDKFVWSYFDSPETVGQARLSAMKNFLADYAQEENQEGYVNASLPILPFADNQFKLALCSHFLFLYSAQFSEAFHIQSIQELCRVAQEIRIFPLYQLGTSPSPYVEPVKAHFQQAGYQVDLVTVPYEFQQGANQMMQIVVK